MKIPFHLPFLLTPLLVVGCGITDLHNAAGSGDVALVQRELAKGADVNAQSNVDHWTPLMYAARNGSPEVIDLLIQRGAAVHQMNSGNGTALHIAAFHEQPANVAMLLARRADPNQGWDHARTPLDLAVASEKTSNLPVIEILVRAGARIENRNLDEAVVPGKETALLLLLLARQGFPLDVAVPASLAIEASAILAPLPPSWEGMTHFAFRKENLALAMGVAPILEQKFPGLCLAVFGHLTANLRWQMGNTAAKISMLSKPGIGETMFNGGKPYLKALEIALNQTAALFRLIHLHAAFLPKDRQTPGSDEEKALQAEMAAWIAMRDTVVAK